MNERVIYRKDAVSTAPSKRMHAGGLKKKEGGGGGLMNPVGRVDRSIHPPPFSSSSPKRQRRGEVISFIDVVTIVKSICKGTGICQPLRLLKGA